MFFVIVLNLFCIWILEEFFVNEIIDLVYECIREGLEDVFYVYLINNEVNVYNLRMLYYKCEDFKEIIVKDYKKDRIIGKFCLIDKIV